MKVKPNPEYDLFLNGLRKTKRRFTKWNGIAFRAAPLEFARLSKLLDGKGSLRFGGRWSAAGTYRAVNLSLTPETALEESGANFTHYNLTSADVRPKIIVGVQLRLAKVIDLARASGLAKERWLRLPELLREDWRSVNDAGMESLTQAFGRAAHDAGAEGLLVPSARVTNGINLVYLPESVLGKEKIKIIGHEELARWLKSR